MSGDIPIYDFPEGPEGFERLIRQVEGDLGWSDMNMRRDRPYYGQPHTSTGQRGATEIQGITFRDLRDCYIRAICQSAYPQHDDLRREAEKGESAALCENDVYRFDFSALDPMAIFNNLACEVEKIMGIYPNAPGAREVEV